jgi:hypothetical protein
MLNQLKSYQTKLLLLGIPVFYLIWTIFINHLAGPFAASRCDPEYMYLMNGLNCAVLKFNMIGHIDNPGTPIQLLTGLFIRITHFLSGQKPIIEDVLSRPDSYIMWASVYLTIISVTLIYWLGKTAWKYTKDIFATVVLQSSVLLNPVFLDLPIRYNPDRILILYVILFIILCLNYFFSGKITPFKFAIISGVLMGIGVASKFNFLPLIIIPFFLIPKLKNRFYYGLSFIISGALSISPIWNKFSETRRFFANLITHDGLYGQGTKRILNIQNFANNLELIFKDNIAFSIVAISALIILLIWIFKKEKASESRIYYIFLALFLVSALIGMIMVAKHFKNYYLAPVMSLTGFSLFFIWKIVQSQYKFPFSRLFFSITLMILVLISFDHQYPYYKQRIKQRNATSTTQDFIKKNIGMKDLWFIEPTWLAGPMVENALAYGISWVAHRHRLYDNFHKCYPNVLTWEGANKNPKWFRTVEADPESILKSGRDIFIYSSPGRNASTLISWLDSLSFANSIEIQKDTVFVNPENDDKIIRVKNKLGWKLKNSDLSPTQLLRGTVTLNSLGSVTERIVLSDVQEGDYIEVTTGILNQDIKNPGRLILKSLQSDTDGIYFEDSHSLQDIGNQWQLLRLRGRIQKTPIDGKMECLVYYPGRQTIKVRNLEIQHMGIVK